MAFDPSVSYMSNFLGDNVPFLGIGARLLETDSFQIGYWFLADVPLLSRALSMQSLQVLKMDCEGCEYALANSVQKHDPCFFHKVDQFAVEIHITKLIAKTRAHIDGLGQLYFLLEAAGLELVNADLLYCNFEHAAAGTLNYFGDFDYPNKANQYCQTFYLQGKESHLEASPHLLIDLVDLEALESSLKRKNTIVRM